jgi:hypothetical protein
MIYIIYSNGRTLQGIVLAIGNGTIRVAVKDSCDAVEFRLINQVWVSEDCEVVTVEFTERIAVAASEQDDRFETMFPAESHDAPIQRVM